MAESKEGWGPLEIILAIVLGIAFLTYITGKSIGPAPVIPRENTADAGRCALSMIRPKPLEKVAEYATVTGAISQCEKSLKQYASLYARMVDANNIPVSAQTRITIKKTSATSATFASTIRLTNVPITRTGYIIISPDPQFAESELSARVPITFADLED